VYDSSNNTLPYLASKRLFYLNIFLQHFKSVSTKLMTKILARLKLAHIQHATTLLKQFNTILNSQNTEESLERGSTKTIMDILAE
jgi:hypothetical protein